MIASPLSILRFRIIFSATWWVIVIMDVALLQNLFGISFRIALIDGLVTNILLILFFLGKSLVIRAVIGFLLLGCVTLISILWYNWQEQKENEKRERDAEKLARDAELFKLRQQLQPHFLFNSLNSINALIGMKPDEA